MKDLIIKILDYYKKSENIKANLYSVSKQIASLMWEGAI